MDDAPSSPSVRAAPAAVDTSAVITPIGRQYLHLQRIPEVGPIRLSRLLTHFGSPEAILAASAGALQHVEGVGPQTARNILAAREDAGLDDEIAQAEAVGARIRCLADADYPVLLRQIPDPPTCLFIRGQLEAEDAVAIAVVGARHCSQYGREQAHRLAGLLAGAGFTVVSGLARGIDGQAHRGALAAQGRTLAVMGNGLCHVYPPEHAELAEQIAENGALLSELPLATPPDTKNFPGRNRIVVGMTLGVLVVEAGSRSGALISAQLATEYNREVFALPGRVDQPAISAGTNALIRRGHAKLVTRLEDILDELGPVGAALQPDQPIEPPLPADCLWGSETAEQVEDGPPLPRRLSLPEARVWEALNEESAGMDRLCAITGLASGQVAAALTTLRLKGLVEQLPGARFRVRPPSA